MIGIELQGSDIAYNKYRGSYGGDTRLSRNREALFELCCSSVGGQIVPGACTLIMGFWKRGLLEICN